MQTIASSVLNIQRDSIGTEIATECIMLVLKAKLIFKNINFWLIAWFLYREYSNNFKPNLWAWNGPGTLNRVLAKVCGTENVAAMNTTTCNGFKIYPSEYFSAIQWFEYQIFFRRNFKDLVLKRINNSYGVHFWNNLSKYFKTVKDSAIDQLMEKYCPMSYELGID